MPTNEDNLKVLRLKTTIVALVSFGLGVALLTLARSIDGDAEWAWLSFWPLGELGGILVGAGLLGIVWDYFDGNDRERREDSRLRRLLTESAPVFRDAVVQGFAVESEDLKRVATPELLDSIAGNALGLRLGDREFAGDIYGDLVRNVVRAPERWYDADVRIRLSAVDAKGVPGIPRFAVTVTWEYSTVPMESSRRFACTSNRSEFHELVTDLPSTSAWFMTPHQGFDPASQLSFELLQFSVNGADRPVRRTARKSSQIYTARIGEEVVEKNELVRIRHVYRTITAKHGHLLMLTVAQPTKGMTLSIDYTDTDIAMMRVSDHVASASRPRLAHLPKGSEAREITMDVPGWLLPQTEVTFVWSLIAETPPTDGGAETSYLAG